MSHVHPFSIDLNHFANLEPLKPAARLRMTMWGLVALGLVIACLGLADIFPRRVFWGAFYVNVIFWMGIAAGGVMISVIFQVVRAKWAPPVRRIAEANIAFLPWALLLLACSYFGRQELFPWGSKPMPGREWWMRPDFVFSRCLAALGFLYSIMWIFIRLSLRGDVGISKERATKTEHWARARYRHLIDNWRGEAAEVERIDKKRTVLGPIIIFLYAIIYSLFTFDMVMGMDTVFFSNMMGGFVFIGNIYGGWVALAVTVVFLRGYSSDYNSIGSAQELHDIGKLIFGFGILWAYLFLAQFLPIWYGNMPEETQWMILRTREAPWNLVGWTVLGACFVLPFITLLSRDVKKNGSTLLVVCYIICAGLWLERYLLIMPQLSPDAVPIGLLEAGLFLGFLGLYVICIQNFLAKYPLVPLCDPLTSLKHAET